MKYTGCTAGSAVRGRDSDRESAGGLACESEFTVRLCVPCLAGEMDPGWIASSGTVVAAQAVNRETRGNTRVCLMYAPQPMSINDVCYKCSCKCRPCYVNAHHISHAMVAWDLLYHLELRKDG